MAREFNTNTRDIFNNRLADKIAKASLEKQKKSHHKTLSELTDLITQHQLWLANIHVFSAKLPQPAVTNLLLPRKAMHQCCHFMTMNWRWLQARLWMWNLRID